MSNKDSLNIDEEAQFIKEAMELDYITPDIPDQITDIGEATGENWRDFEDISTNSLWIIGARAREGAHNGQYHGNFVPQIPYQAIRRFTKPGDIVLDTFLGSGTTLIECRRLGRNGIGIELIESIANAAKARIYSQPSNYDTWQEVICGDSTEEKTMQSIRKELEKHGRNQVQLLIMHPPYHDIIKFSDDQKDLCNAPTLGEFLERFKQVVRETYYLLEKDHFLVVVIGDKYGNREWIPLGFHVMEAVKSIGYTLKSVVVKNIEGNRAKRNLDNFWRQRAFRGKYYIFKHEYVLFFQKTEIFENLMKIVDLVKEMDNREEEGLITDASFVSGDLIDELAKDYPWFTPARFLGLRRGKQIRAVVLDLTGIEITQESVRYQLEDFISRLPDRDKIIEVSLLVEPEKRAVFQGIQIPGVSEVYSPDEISIRQLARTIYVVSKAIGFGQRAGRASGVAFSQMLNAILEKIFDSGTEYDWSPRRGISFKFFKENADASFDEILKEKYNFRIGIATKWVDGHENEKMPQIRDRYYKKGFTLIAIVGPNVEKWREQIKEKGNFAQYYLFVDRENEQSLEDFVEKQCLTEAVEQYSYKESKTTLIELLKQYR